MQKIIMFDVDGVLADFLKGFTTLMHALGHGVPIISHLDSTQWNLDSRFFPKAAQAATWDHVKGSREFWRKLPALASEDDFRRVSALNSEHDVYFVTSRPGWGARWQTESWLREHGVMDPVVIVTHRKGEAARVLGAHFSIEDNVKNASCVSWLTDGATKSYLLDRAYNVSEHGTSSDVIRVRRLSEYLDAAEAT